MTLANLQRLADQHGGRIPADKAADALRAMYRTRRHKYGAEPTIIAGVRFDSKGEAKCYGELRLMELAGEISDLRRQVRIPLVGADNKPLMFESGRQAVYVADFMFKRKGDTDVTILDHKGYDTPDSKLKRAIVAAMFGRPVEIHKAPRK